MSKKFYEVMVSYSFGKEDMTDRCIFREEDHEKCLKAMNDFVSKMVEEKGYETDEMLSAKWTRFIKKEIENKTYFVVIGICCRKMGTDEYYMNEVVKDL